MAKALKTAFKTGAEINEWRKTHRMIQSEFWGPLGVTQSGGSRYESGRNIPAPTQILLTLAYGTDKEADAVLAALRTWKSPKKGA
ncbi:MAG: helix-turn-helix domain-containing protein [Zoogloeaceae bacterium]|nr:helix-turn-helix domain-containing protein [Zoogloeaceae bacterium]